MNMMFVLSTVQLVKLLPQICVLLVDQTELMPQLVIVLMDIMKMNLLKLVFNVDLNVLLVSVKKFVSLVKETELIQKKDV